MTQKTRSRLANIATLGCVVGAACAGPGIGTGAGFAMDESMPLKNHPMLETLLIFVIYGGLATIALSLVLLAVASVHLGHEK